MYTATDSDPHVVRVPPLTDPGDGRPAASEPPCDDARTARDLASQAYVAWTQGDRAAARALADVARVYACLAERADHADTRLNLAKAQLKAETARAEAAAEAADDYARLTPRQRSARRVARMLLAVQPDMAVDKLDHEAVPLAMVMERLSVSVGTACEIRKDAMALLVSGYGHQHVAADAAYEPVDMD